MAAVAVIVPCHDNRAHVAAALDSILAQSHGPTEVIVVDDGSRDGSGEVVRRFGDRVRLIEQANAGAAAARNTGVAATTAPMLAFLDADDVWPARSLAVRLDVLAATGAGLAYGAVRQCLDDAGPDAAAMGPDLPGRLAGALLVRRDVFEAVGPFDARLSTAETIDWVARADALGIHSAACPDIVLYRRIHAANMMRGNPAADGNCLAVLRGAVHRRRAAAAC